MWDALRDIALYRSLSLAELLLEIEESCDPGEGLADAIRIYIVKFYRSILADVMSGRDDAIDDPAPRNVMLDTHKTSLRLEPVMWEALDDIARAEGVTAVTAYPAHR